MDASAGVETNANAENEVDDSGIGGDVGDEEIDEDGDLEQKTSSYFSASRALARAQVAAAATRILATTTRQPLAGYLPCLLADLGTMAQHGRPYWSLDGKAQGVPKFKAPAYHVIWAAANGPSDRRPGLQYSRLCHDTACVEPSYGESESAPVNREREDCRAVAKEETPAVTDQKAEKKAAKKERKSEMKALLEAGGEPASKNHSDRKLWAKVEAKEEPVGNDDKEEEGEEFVGLGNDDSGFADYNSDCTDDEAFVPGQLTDDLQEQTESIASEPGDGVMRPVVNDEITIEDFEMIDDIVPEPTKKRLTVKLKITRVAAMNAAAGAD
ncbi:hypothetical protein LTR15_012680 [Elasticomyces elasticus]|nr:hypothetical protein LTR15_012680 [Elasticomyces elasticus]